MNYSNLDTEKRNPESLNLDSLSALEAVRLMNRLDSEVSAAVIKAENEIADAVNLIALSFKKGGRLVYTGAGTSGRLGVLDASECPPTFGTNPDMVVGIIAGGDKALRSAVENVEDDANAAVDDLKNISLNERDILVSISASGSARYCISAVNYAKSVGAKAVCIVCAKGSSLAGAADIAIEIITGPEILTGSTRLRAGTATKMVLNMLSTLSMVQMGKVYQNLMVDMVPTNNKLHNRAIRIVCEATGCSEETAVSALDASSENIKTAIVSILTGKDINEAGKLLKQSDGFVAKAIEMAEGSFAEAAPSKTADNENTVTAESLDLVSPCDGMLIPMSDIPDDVFSSGVMGKCIAVEPDSGEIYAPVNGTVMMIAETLHAITLQSASGDFILIHMGLDTVKLKGEGFETAVKEGDEVLQGQLIAKMDLDLIKKSGYKTMVILAKCE